MRWPRPSFASGADRHVIRERWSRLVPHLLSPRTIIVAFMVFLVLTVLSRPHIDDMESDARLTTYAADAYGARGLYDVLERLGWHVTRRTTPLELPLDTAATYVILAPPVALTQSEVHAVLSAVRRGASLLVVPVRGSPLADSLRLRPSAAGWHSIVEWEEDREEDGERDTLQGGGAMRRALAALMVPVPNECEPGVFDPPLGTRWLSSHLEQRGPLPGEPEVFLQVRVRQRGRAERLRPAVMGFPMGAGRVVAVADPHLLRNDVIRLCEHDAGVLAVRAFTWLGAPGGEVVFDEYHQGFGRHPSVVRATASFLRGTSPGRMLLQAIVAGLILLIAVSVRPIRPRPMERIERRSPLEHVGALARAYEQVGATRTATRRLVRGLRRRHAAGAPLAGSDERFLQSITALHPDAAPDVALLLEAERRQLSPDELLRVGQAVDHLDRTMTK